MRRQTESKRNKKTEKQRDSLQRPMVVIPYVENVSEAVARIITACTVVKLLYKPMAKVGGNHP